MDFSVTALLVEVFGVWYVPSVAVGAVCGAITNFLMGRHWTFEAADGKASRQLLRYAFVSLLSLGLNTSLVWVVTENWLHNYLLSKAVVAFLVGVFFNFPLHRRFVFRSEIG